MPDSLRYIAKQIDRDQINAQTARQQAQTERDQTGRDEAAGRESDKDYHNQQAQQFDDRADQLEAEAQQLESQKAEVEARVNELKTQRETLNRETLEKIMAIDKELAQLQGGLTI